MVGLEDDDCSAVAVAGTVAFYLDCCYQNDVDSAVASRRKHLVQVEDHYRHHLYLFHRHRRLVSCYCCCYCCEMTPYYDRPAYLSLLEPWTKTLAAPDRAAPAHVYSPDPTIPGTPARPGYPGGCALPLQLRESRLFLSAVA